MTAVPVASLKYGKNGNIILVAGPTEIEFTPEQAVAFAGQLIQKANRAPSSRPVKYNVLKASRGEDPWEK